MKRIATLLLIALASTVADAQDEFLEELPAEEVRHYQVEIIIFSYEEQVSVGTEIFVPDEPPPEEELWLDEDLAAVADETPTVREEPQDAARQADEDDPELADEELRFVLLTEDEFTLTDVARQFELLDVYETIMHFGWIQPAYPQEETLPIELRLLGEPPDGLEGSFTLYLSRYLHLVVDLTLDSLESAEEPAGIDAPVYTDDPGYSFGVARLQNFDLADPATRPVRFRIQENRIVKNGDLRYFDHPKFGVLAKITKVEEDEDDNEVGLEEPLLSSTRN